MELLLEKLETTKYLQLVNILQQNNNWMRVAEFLKFISVSEIRKISEPTSPCPAEKLLNIFITQSWKLKRLRRILEKCELYQALDIISEPEPMRIVSQPTSIILNEDNILILTKGAALKLKFDVTGIPRPRYQWYKRNRNREDQILQDENSCTLEYANFESQMVGTYFCLASQNENQLVSEVVEVGMQMKPCKVTKKLDQSVYFYEGSRAVLEVKVVGYPEPDYQWYFENEQLENETADSLVINNAKIGNRGKYKCLIKNQINEVVEETYLFIYCETRNDAVYNGPVSDKVALLISNEDYENMLPLQNPSNDVSTIALILKALNFRTLCFQNLNLQEIKMAIDFFSHVVDKNAIVFFYYAGHGFEMGDKFLLPVNCPKWESVKKCDAIPESLILNQILNKDPILFLVVLDMCLRMPESVENSSIYRETFAPHEFRSNRNLIRAYSTTTNLPAYEARGSANGIYVDALKKHLQDDVPVLIILSEVNNEIFKICPQQIPSVFNNTTKDFYLSCQIRDEQNVPQQEYLEKLNIENEIVVISKTTIRLQMYKEVFNNCIQVNITDNLFQCRFSPSFKPIEKIEDNQIVLEFQNLQRTKEDQFLIEFKINNTTVAICRDLKFDFFRDII